MEAKKKRIELLDELRGFAILAMIVHHFFLDVGDILQLDWGYKIFNELCTVQPIFWAIFIIISGICSRLSRNAVKRGLIVFGAGLVITFVTVVIMPRLMGIDGAKIYFGILHCLGACMIITGLAMPLIEKIDARIGVLICAVLFS
ncbi:heparan-alpha-glucosaminide N-acetyltransferase domain-containing protein, partial [Eubacterium coprostanoligenes]|uniref:heparan-alpha-glucosaminide N-acetyltransferase domain-containing protein n=2 Tax=Eubacterium TaxID=1730 RepID=UPI0023566C0B